MVGWLIHAVLGGAGGTGWCWTNLSVGGVGGGQDLGPGRADGADAGVVDVGGSVHPDPGVAVLVVVPAVEGLAEGAGVLDRADEAPQV